jgi:CARDB
VRSKTGNLLISLVLALLLCIGLTISGSHDLGADYQSVGTQFDSVTYGYSGIVTTTTTTITPTSSPATTPLVTLEPATFESSTLVINPSDVKPGEGVNIYVKITNTGDVAGNDNVVLKINNQIIETKDVSLASGSGTVVTFTTIGKAAGNYDVAVAGLDGNFTVSKSATPLWFWLSAAAAFIMGVVLTAAFVFIKYRNN